jgi:hypothetical protein
MIQPDSAIRICYLLSAIPPLPEHRIRRLRQKNSRTLQVLAYVTIAYVAARRTKIA